MNNAASPLFVSVHGAFMTFDPTASMADASKASNSNKETSAKKGACGKCTICKCKRSFGA